MNKIKLTQGKFVIVDDEDFEYLNQFKWYFAHGYAFRRFWNKDKKHHEGIFMHQLINKTPKGYATDHINRDRLDNRKSNLRTVTDQQNTFNRSLSNKNKSGYKGVFWVDDRSKWRAFIKINKKWIHLGFFNIMEDAIRARQEGEIKYHAI